MNKTIAYLVLHEVNKKVIILYRSIPTFLALLFVLLLSACPNTYTKADNALSSSSFVDAENIAREELKSHPEDPGLRLILAEALVGQKRFADANPIAKTLFEETQDEKKKSGIQPSMEGRIHQTYGKTEWELGRTLKAIGAWQKARTIDASLVPTDQYIRALETGILYAESKFDFTSSIRLRQELMTLEPENKAANPTTIREARRSEAAALERNGRYEDAIKSYDALSKEYPSEHDLLFTTGHLQALMRDRDETAKRTFLRYIELGKGEEKAVRTLAVASRLDSLNSEELAVVFYEKAAQFPALRKKQMLTLARLKFKLTKTKSAKADLMEFISLSNKGQKIGSARPYVRAAEIPVGFHAPHIAIEILEKGAQKAAPNWRLSRMLANLYSTRGKPKDAERVLEYYVKRSIENEPDNAQKALRYKDVGTWAWQRRNYKLAKFFFEKAELLDRSDDILIDLAQVYASLGYISDLRRTMRQYVKQGEKKAERFLRAASMYQSQRMYEEAEKMYLLAIKAKDSDFSTIRSLETMYRAWGKTKRISGVFESWVKSRGGKSADQLMIGERYYRQGNWNDAEKYLKLAAKGGENEAWITLADIYKRNQNGAKMKDAIDNYLAKASNKTLALVEAAKRYSSSRWTENAIPIYEELMEKKPKTFSHFKSLSEILFQKGENEKAQKVLKQYINNSAKKTRAMQTILRSYSRPRYSKYIIAIFEEVLKKDKNVDPKIYLLLGDAYIKSNKGSRIRRPYDTSLFVRPNKAKHFYKMYLENTKDSAPEIKRFGAKLANLQFWGLATLAYEKLQDDEALSSSILFEFGIALLNVGKSDRAEKTFEKYYIKRNKSQDAARQIADQLYSHQRFSAALPYLKRGFESSNGSNKESAFIWLVNVYIATDQSEKIRDLANNYIKEAQNPIKARTTLLTTLQNRGLWELASEQLEKMIKSEGEEFSYQLALSLFTQGRDDEVRETLTAFASENINQVEAWLRVAQFYELRGWNEDAENAYSNATQNASNEKNESSLRALFEFAKFQIKIGNVDEGQDKYAQGRKAKGMVQIESEYFNEISVLMKFGYFDRARKIAKEALPNVFSGKPFLFSAISAAQFGNSVDQQNRHIAEMKSAGLPTADIIKYLIKHKLYEEAISVLDIESVTGDPQLASSILLEHLNSFLEIGGVERVLQSAQPLIDSNQTMLLIPMASLLMKQGKYQDALIYLKKVNVGLYPNADELLADCYLHLSDFGSAFSHLQNDMLTSADPTATLLGFITKANNTGHGKVILENLKQLSSDPLFSANARPVFIAQLLEAQNIDGASEHIRSIWKGTEKNPFEIQTAAINLKNALQEFAFMGFADEGLFLLEELPKSLQEDPSLSILKLQLLAYSSRKEGDQLLIESASRLTTTPIDNARRLNIAKFAIASGRFQSALTIAEPLLKSSQLNNSALALSILLSVHFARPDLVKDAKATLNTFLKAHQDKSAARKKALLVLSKLGMETMAKGIAIEEYQSQPTEISIHGTLSVLEENPSVKESEKWIEKLWRTSNLPTSSLQKLALSPGVVMTPALYEIVLNYLEKSEAFSVSSVERRARYYYLSSNPKLGRESLQEFLNKHSNDAEALLVVLRFLDRWGLPGEIVSWAISDIDVETAPTEILKFGGLALQEVGKDTQAKSWFKAAMKRSPTPYRTAADLARVLGDRQLYAASKALIEPVIQHFPKRLRPYEISAIAAIGLGDVEKAKKHHLLSQTIGFPYALFRAALIANKVEFATTLATPFFSNRFDPDSISFVIREFVTHGKAKEGIAFLEKTAPELLKGNGVAQTYTRSASEFFSDTWVWPFADLYEAAGEHERAKGFLRASLQKKRYVDWAQMSNPTNSLAYKNATTNTDLDEGEALIKLSLAFFPYYNRPSSSSAYIDTLGWIQYRKGEFEKAERTIKKAISKQDTQDGNTIPNVQEIVQFELLSHLVTVLEARGKHKEAQPFLFRMRLLEKRNPRLRH